MQLNGTFGVPRWKWLFLLEGLPAVLLSVFGMSYLTDRPHMAKWLSASEQQWLQQQIDSEVKASSSHHDAGMRALLKKPVLWLLAFGYIGVFFGNSTLGVWLP
ncbi:MFS transporter [Noviherbaspirillum pedocola]|uniref:MFS transporter n=1 Tax=Noviherbaspirillum pedocola TaxID=2801341 RepID=A0A934WAD7_9BURK|nr:MFS transporter [Noviherbaspirillum pedocola]MBK4738684.1 MFS transporter [Noviherbaspirillum pedocola]